MVSISTDDDFNNSVYYNSYHIQNIYTAVHITIYSVRRKQYESCLGKIISVSC